MPRDGGRMRTLLVNSARRGGGGLTATVELSVGLVERGHEITVVGHPKSGLSVQLGGIPGLSLEHVAIRAELNPYRVLQLARLFRRIQPNLVLADKRKDVKLSVAARALTGRFPVVHRHGAPSRLVDTFIYRYVWGRNVESVITNSCTMRERMLERAPWLERVPIHVIHNGKDTSYYRPRSDLRSRVRAELGIPENAFVVSFHGMVGPRKNVQLAIKAVAALPPELRVHTLIIGGGSDLREVQELSTQLDAPVTFTGVRADIPELLSAVDAATHLSTAEGFSNSVLEAMACGLPMIASRATSHPEQIEDGKQGILVPPHEWEPVARAIARLASDSEECRRMGRAARERVVSEFSREQMMERYDEVLRRAVETYEARGR